MADLIKVALIGGGAFLAWKYFMQPATTAAHESATPAPPDPNKITGQNTLDGVYARLVAAAPSGSHGVDEWNAYLAPLLSVAPPDPMPLFQAAASGFAREQQITAGQYWAVMAPWLKQNAGLSGLGPKGLGWMAGGWN